MVNARALEPTPELPAAGGAPADVRRALERFFAPDGALSKSLPAYEQRGAQSTLAVAVADVLGGGHKLLAEAGTGTGKTLAYLVPALASGLRVVVSTGTKNLQEQLLGKDLPVVERAAGRSFDVVVVKGRSNYLCELRYERTVAQLRLPGIAERRLLADIGTWRNETQTGDRAELRQLSDDAPLWREVSATAEQCSGRRCPHFERCWVTKVRQRAVEAQLVVVNHHLYFADAALRQRLGDPDVAVLPRHDAVVFDEAHELDEIAGQYFGCAVSERRFFDLTADARAASEGTGTAQKVIRDAAASLEVAVAQLYDTLPFVTGRRRLRPAELRAPSLDAHAVVDQALGALAAQLAGSSSEDAPALARRCAQLGAELAFVLAQRSGPSAVGEVLLPSERDTPRPGDRERGIVRDLESSPGGDPSFDDLGPRPARRAGPGASEGENGASQVPFVRFTEATARNRVLAARPLEVAPFVAEVLAPMPVVFTSATLAIADDFAHIKERLGVRDARELVVPSPFSWEEQALLYLPEDLPGVDDPDFAERACQRITELVTGAGGGAFVLCTSNRMVEAVASRLRAALPYTVLAQGSSPRTHLIEQFRADGNAVLVATLSFWRGVDVPGRALRLVILDRLPFAAPGDPVIEARLEWLRWRGESPFNSYQLPMAALLLRQGFGRLIRSRQDRGVVAILDQRIVRKSYGQLLLRSLPPCPRSSELEPVLSYLAGC